MINVVEQIPNKLSGRTSFRVSFPYNEQLVSIVKTMKPAIWDKANLCWEISASYLHHMLDTFVMYDEVELKLLPPEIQPISEDLTEKEISDFRYKPFAHQVEGINFLVNRKKSLLLDSMGVGKSLQIMYTAEVLHKRGEVEHCLIVCGVDSLRSNWKSEIQKFSNESVRVLGEKISKKGRTSYTTISERVEELKKPINEFFVVVNIASLRKDSVIQAISRGPNKFDMIVVDEIHKCLTGDSVVQTELGNLTLSELNSLTVLPKVLSYNIKTGQNEFKQISNIWVSDPTENLLELVVEDDSRQYSIKCTESHEIYTTNRGWVKAKDLTEFDDIKIS